MKLATNLFTLCFSTLTLSFLLALPHAIAANCPNFEGHFRHKNVNGGTTDYILSQKGCDVLELRQIENGQFFPTVEIYHMDGIFRQYHHDSQSIGIVNSQYVGETVKSTKVVFFHGDYRVVTLIGVLWFGKSGCMYLRDTFYDKDGKVLRKGNRPLDTIKEFSRLSENPNYAACEIAQ